MRAVWSLWTKPLKAKRRMGWLSPRHHLLAWVLSVELASRHHADTCLVADDEAAAVLVDALGLRFGSVSLALNALDAHDPDWWAIGKLYAQAGQDRPYVHIDSDVFLWEPLPEPLLRTAVFAQNPEISLYGASYYRPESIEHDIRRHGGWMPEEFEHYMPFGGELRAENCGIVGGTRVDFLRYYAQRAIDFIEHPANQSVWAQRPRRDQDFVTFEQLMLSACLAYHQARAVSPFAGVTMAHLFDSHDDALARANARGYTHLAADSKRDPDMSRHLEEAVARHFPEHYRRVVDFLQSPERGGASSAWLG
ncbi:hypothetical protein J2X65_000595 [Ancylobacter sp. 3268]|uniref:DUF6734 family protein n=1 Tax=Ancylobacter sp. 3268 TaxID=2817752 RepID=UPI00285D068E|nr:DUF6734 family protein [Ancylobacter sp. 3268]MDR6951247.1 hypothetical protein [Ancylobacter sp. 3268]